MKHPREPKNPLPPHSPEMRARTIHIPQDDRTRPVMVRMYEAERKRALAAIEPVAYALSDAASVFKLISEGLSTGHFARNDPGIISVTNICAAHFQALAEKEAEYLLMLHRNLQNTDPPQDPKEEAQ
jgi:hypothetical protein